MAKLRLKWLRSLGPIGTLIANAILFLTTNWWLVVSIIAGIVSGAWASAVAFFQRPPVEVGIGVWLVTLWTIVGTTTLIDRRKSRMVRVEPDYRYGLTLEQLTAHMEPSAETGISFFLQVRNFSSAPIRCTVEDFDVRIETRALPRITQKIYGYLARGGAKTIGTPTFQRDHIKEFFGKRVTGSVHAVLTYGHPESKPQRRLTIDCEIILVIAENGQPPLGFGMNITGENDAPIEDA